MNRVEYFRKNMSGKCLDIGCNSGRLHQLLEKGKNLYGLDVVIDKPGPKIRKGSAEDMPFENGSFDTFIAGEVIEHLDSPENFIRESRRVLRDNGVLLLSTPNRKALTNRLFHKFDAADPDEYSGHQQVFTTAELAGLCEKYLAIEDIFLLPYDEVSSPDQARVVYWVRKFIHHFLPNSLREEIILKLRKK